MKRLVEREALLREPSIFVRRSPPRDRGVDAEQRVYRLDGRIGSEGEHRTTLKERSPWVGARRAPRSPVPVREVAVARAVDRLHRGDHAQGAEPPEIVFAHELHVLEPLPKRR